mmetsp:Transcript_7705/g.11601  ORF Transcript_7705/g.11601 Transcript_7705/m.11601 type:complete len:225 (+) Transcript_7705:156-830(+)
MLTDTVGFIQKLPTNLVAAFRATLEEVNEADIIVHVCDISNGVWSKQFKAVIQVLQELGVTEKRIPIVTLWNKLDLISEGERALVQAQAQGNELTVAASAKTGVGMENFIATLEVALSSLLLPVEVMIPFSKGDLLSKIHELGASEFEEYRHDGCYVVAKVPEFLLNKLEPFYTEEFKAKRTQSRNVILENGGIDADEAANELAEIEWAALAKGRHSLSKHKIN